MPAANPLTEFAGRKRLLVLEADLQRTLIRAECVRLHARLHSVREAAKSVSPWLLAAGTLAGLLAVKQWRHWARWVPTAFAACRALRGRTGG